MACNWRIYKLSDAGASQIKITDIKLLLSEIWDALRAAAEGELNMAQTIIESAGIIVQNPDLTVCYDERGDDCSTIPYTVPLNLLLLCESLTTM